MSLCSSSEKLNPSESKRCCSNEPRSATDVYIALFAALPFVRPQPGINLDTVCAMASRQLHSVGQLLEDQMDTLRAQRDEALELASIRLHVTSTHSSNTLFVSQFGHRYISNFVFDRSSILASLINRQSPVRT